MLLSQRTNQSFGFDFCWFVEIRFQKTFAKYPEKAKLLCLQSIFFGKILKIRYGWVFTVCEQSIKMKEGWWLVGGSKVIIIKTNATRSVFSDLMTHFVRKKSTQNCVNSKKEQAPCVLQQFRKKIEESRCSALPN